MAAYLSMEVEGIQKFVFAAPKLKPIRGGSAMLDTFNREVMKNLALELAKIKEDDILVLCGGNALIRLPSADIAEKLVKTLERKLRDLTEGQATLSWGIADDTGSWRDDVRPRLKEDTRQRALLREDGISVLPPFVGLCGFCGVAPAGDYPFAEEQERLPKPLCKACDERVHQPRLNAIWKQLQPDLNISVEELLLRLPDGRFDNLTNEAEGRGYLAYLYCDGNGMGRILDKTQSPEEYSRISRLVDRALHKAVAAALNKYGDHSIPDWVFAADVLMLGGDDLIMVLDANLAADFASTVLRTFYWECEQELRSIGAESVRLSAGLVFAPYNTPLSILNNVATQLLRSAKRRAYLDEVRERCHRRSVETPSYGSDTEGDPLPLPAADGYIDFQELTSGQIDIDRESDITCRPYRLDEFETLLERTRAAKGVPRSRLHALAQAIHGSWREAFSMTQLIVARTTKLEQRSALEKLLVPPCLEVQEVAMPYTQNRKSFPFPASAALPLDLYPPDHKFSPLPDALELLNHVTAGEDQP